MPSIETLNSRWFISGKVAATIFRWKIEFLETAEGLFFDTAKQNLSRGPTGSKPGFW